MSRYSDSTTQGLHKYVESILNARCYLVGGAVRDFILREKIYDYDFSTALPPDEIEHRIVSADRHAYTVGKRFGTVGFKSPNGLYHFEITTFRVEAYAKDSRKPRTEFGVSLNEDLLRRDFTINAMALRSDGRLVDPFSGRYDLRSKILRTPNKPKQTFNDDPLRIMRGARFATRYRMTLDEPTFRAMKDRAHRLTMLSTERVYQELTKILQEDKPSIGLKILADAGALPFILPELAIQVGYDQNSKYHALPLFEHTLAVVDGVPDDPSLRMAALLHDIGKPSTRSYNTKTGYCNYLFHEQVGSQLSRSVLQRFHASNATIEKVSSLVLHHLEESSPLRPYDDAAHA